VVDAAVRGIDVAVQALALARVGHLGVDHQFVLGLDVTAPGAWAVNRTVVRDANVRGPVVRSRSTV
jgi:hypothetical protein